MTPIARRWEKAGQPPEILREFPHFASFLDSSLLLSQMKVTRDKVSLQEGEPALLVEGKWIKDRDFYKRFEICRSRIFNTVFVVEKESRDVYTYLDNGKGLQKHHPFLSAQTAISTLNSEDYEKTLSKAREFVRPEEASLSPEEKEKKNESRTFVLQYVTSKINAGDSHFDRLIRNPKHSFLRLVIGQDNPSLGTKKGEVYEAGYGWKQEPSFPCITTQGAFRSPDPWEYKPSEKIVTNIAITQEEAHNFYRFTQRYHADGIHLGHGVAFNLLKQNCSAYSREACLAAGVEIPTEISLKETIHRIIPDKIRELSQVILKASSAATDWFVKNKHRVISQKVSDACILVCTTLANLMYKVAEVFIACALIPVRICLGEAFGEGGRAFRQLNDPEEDLIPPLHIFRNWFSLSEYKLYLPGIAQEWQLKQPSTVVYKNPIKLAIVP